MCTGPDGTDRTGGGGDEKGVRGGGEVRARARARVCKIIMAVKSARDDEGGNNCVSFG